MGETLRKQSGMSRLNDVFSSNMFLYISLLTLIIASCSDSNNSINNSHNLRVDGIKYANAFRIDSANGNMVLEIINPQENTIVQRVKIGGQPSDAFDLVLTEKPSKVVLLSTTYVAYLKSLGELKAVSGISNAALIYSPQIQNLLRSGAIKNIGNDLTLNMELLIDLQPDLVLYYNFSSTTSALADQIREYGIPVLFINEFQETSPLGKSEWIKFFGLLFNKQAMADSIFQLVENEYLKLAERKNAYTEKPSVFTALPWKGRWYQPGGNSFQATFFSDAGAHYLWAEDNNVSGITVDREVVFDKALDADYWLHPNNALNLKEISELDERYTSFLSFQTARVYNNNLRLNDFMGNDYWESGIMKPHVILKDLITIFHPDEFPDGDLVYYQKLE